MASLLRRLASYLVPFVVKEAESTVSPGLEVIYSGGSYLLHSRRTNYSEGELKEVFHRTFRALGVYHRPMQTVLVLGLGAGSIVRLLAARGRRPAVTGVELDPKVIELGKAYFGLDRHPNLQIVEADAATYLQQQQGRYDLVCVDVFVDELVPEAMDQLAVIEACKRALAPGGLLIWNRLVHTEQTKTRTEHFLQAFGLIFPHHHIRQMRTNWIVIAEQPDAVHTETT
ncbi:MAG: spermidine synthase [Sphingobacteriia bacterium]|jgi:spermidine synthase